VIEAIQQLLSLSDRVLDQFGLDRSVLQAELAELTAR
jgi:hypothetical protein